MQNPYLKSQEARARGARMQRFNDGTSQIQVQRPRQGFRYDPRDLAEQPDSRRLIKSMFLTPEEKKNIRAMDSAYIEMDQHINKSEQLKTWRAAREKELQDLREIQLDFKNGRPVALEKAIKPEKVADRKSARRDVDRYKEQRRKDEIQYNQAIFSQMQRFTEDGGGSSSFFDDDLHSDLHQEDLDVGGAIGGGNNGADDAADVAGLVVSSGWSTVPDPLPGYVPLRSDEIPNTMKEIRNREVADYKNMQQNSAPLNTQEQYVPYDNSTDFQTLIHSETSDIVTGDIANVFEINN